MNTKTAKIIKIVFISLLVTIFLLAIGLYAYLHILASYNQNKNIALQKTRVSAMRMETPTPINEQDFADFDLNSELKINQIQTLHTHNSYKTDTDKIIKTLYKLGTGKDSSSSDYEHNTLVNQLNNGVRGVELDIRYEKGQFMVYHMGVTDQNSHSPHWELTLEEMSIWSKTHQSHTPIVVLLEVKQDSFLWKPFLKGFTTETFDELDKSILDIIGRENLITPEDIIGDYPDMKTAIAQNNWVSLSEAKGKFMFVLHPTKNLVDTYVSRDTSLKTLPIFPALQINSSDEMDKVEDKDYASIIIYNTPNIKDIQQLVRANYMVRARLDEGLIIDEERVQNALASGAHFLSTDFEKGTILPKSDYISYLNPPYTISLNPVTSHNS